MIIDNHVHVFPDQAGAVGYPDAATYARELQSGIARIWGRLVTSHLDPKYAPYPDEDVGFRVGKYGRFHWKKHGEDCWIQRGPVCMESWEHTPEQMLAHMDSIGVDMAVIQAGYYTETNFGRDVFYADVIKRWPDRFIGTAAIGYDLTKDDQYLEAEIGKLTRAVEERGFKALYRHVGRGQPVDDPRCDALWRETTRLGIPVFMDTGFNSKADYLDQIHRIGNVLHKYGEMNAIDSHIGANVRHSRDPEHVDNPKEFFSLFETGRFHLEVGYVLSYENWDVWGREFEYPYVQHEQIIKTIYENFGAGVMVWGTDMPWAQRTCTYRQNLDLIRLHTDFMTEEDRKLVMGGNVARLFKIG